ncbi:fibronectin type III domain-containing protein [Agriterribacter sp.]|uniref:fibronectin type III domain-containing protein n=1 Tax=Agriterribacter sp. TaxID=2821509 RepID=UPI002B6677E9|nr:fibronectin type III domain-containing protein [Agriterribacter sp.]HTN07991.1 fibronectin type III domain-containing protein [Agriterribacter sp.]
MNRFVRNLVWGCLLVFITGMAIPVVGQVFNPNDPVVVYNPGNPPAEPVFGEPGKWVKTNRLPWNTSSFKAYIYKGIPFRLKWPKNYDASGNTKYPLFLFFHGKGERGSIYDNEYQLFHGGELHKNAVDNGTFNGFLLYPQTDESDGSWGGERRGFIKELIENFLIPQIYVDPFRISVDGLSGGGLSTWKFFEAYPNLIAACLPISSSGSSLNTIIINNKFTPIWLFQGGLDLNPSPISSQYLNKIAQNAGANFTYTEYPNQGHGCWYSAWGEADYFPFLNRANKANPWPLYGKTEFCNTGPGSVNTTIGVTAGFNEYQWRKNGVLLTGEGTASNTLTVTDIGVYSCRIRKGTTWSDWSPLPVEIKYKTSTIPPTIKVSGLGSKVLPAPDGKTTVNLEVPAGYADYKWEKVGDTTTLSNGNAVNGVGIGSYKVKVTEQFGCASTFSNPFTVINANGTNKPDAATNLIVIPLSYTSLKLNWSSNPNPAYPQTNFEIYQATQSGGPYQFISLVDGNVFSFIKEGLTPGVKYYYIVRAVNNTAASPVSNEASAATQKDIEPPTAPGNLYVTGTTRNYVALAWEESTDDVGLDHYEIYINGIKSYVTSETGYTLYGLDYGKIYNFTVKAVDIAGNKSAPSNQVTAQPLAKGLSFKHYTGTWDNLPDFNLLTPISTGVVPNVTLANASQAENYAFLWEGYIRIPSNGNYTFRTNSDDGSKLYLSTYNHTAAALVNNDGLHGSQNADGSITLAAGVYPIAVTFFQKGGGASMSISWQKSNPNGWAMTPIPDAAFVDPPSPPAGEAPVKPSNLTATVVSFKKINLTWSDNSANEKSFELYRSTDPLSGFITIGVLPANATSFSDTLVQPSTTYYYKIRAINQYGESDFDKAGPGIEYAYYEKTGMSVVPDFNTMTPLKTGKVGAFGLGMQMRPDNFAVKFDGFINITTGGVYTFYLQSDDGSRLYIDNNPVVNNDGLHNSANEIPGQVTLTAGVHAIRVTFFEATGGEALIVKYQGPGVTKQDIPASVLGDMLASATTLAPPPVPAAPNGLTAVGISNSAIKVAWVNNATNATGIELYRSYNGNQDYVLLATLPPTTTSYNDAELYPSSLFYYKVRAKGEGGKSGYSNEKDARTLGVVPSVVPIENVYMRYGTQLQLGVEATSGSPVVITLQVSNLPLFAVFNQTANGKGVITFNPSVSDAGVYSNIRVTASNPQGDINTAQFNLIVNDNYVPKITPILNATVKEQESLQVNLSATDNDATDQLAWSYSGLPGFATVASANRSAVLTFNPKYGDEGEYRVKAYVNDGRNGKDTASFILKVAHAVVTNPDDGTIPVNPKNVTGVFVNSLNAVKLTWTNMAYNAIRNEIYRSNYMTGGYVLLNPGASNKDDTFYVDNTVTGNKTFYYLVRAVNANGGSNSLIVKVTTPNRAPVINIEDIYAKSGNVKTVTVTATDDPGDVITLSASNLPSFATFTDNGNGNGVIQLSPTGSHIGTYEGISIKAKDQYGAAFVKTVKIIVTDKYITSVFVNFNNKDYPVNFMPWNSFNAAQVGSTSVAANTTISNLKEETGVVTTMSVKLLEKWPQTYGGIVTGNNSGVFPDSVMMTGYYFYTQASSPQKTVRISGLNNNKRYNLIFFGSRSYTKPQVTYFTAGSQTVSLNATNNGSQTVQINNLMPDQGIIDVVIKADTDKYAVVNAMVIQEYDNTVILPPTNLNMSKSTRSSISLSWKSNTTNLSGFEVWRSDAPNGTYLKLPATIPGNVFTYTNEGLTTGTIYYYKVRAVSGTGFSDFSDYVSGATIKYAVNINFNDGSELGPSQPAPWNNTNQLVYEGFILPNLLNDDNQNTGINMTVVGSLNSFSGTNRQDNSLTTGNNSGVVPDIVMSTFYFLEYSQVGKLRIDGLNQTMRYNFVFYGGCKDRGKGQVTTYTIGNENVNLDAKNNTMNTIQINNVAPDENGSVLISLTPAIVSGFGYINSLGIQAVPSDISIPSGRKVVQTGNKDAVLLHEHSVADPKTAGNVIVGTYPNPFVDDIMLKLSLDNPVNRIVVMLKDISGKLVFSTTVMNLQKGINERKLGLKGSRLSPGIYGLQLLGMPGGGKTAIIVVK